MQPDSVPIKPSLFVKSIDIAIIAESTVCVSTKSKSSGWIDEPNIG